jgi:hypothetical protein
MEFNLTWILLGLPAAFVLGWLASRWDLRQVRADNRQAPKAYFKGLNFLLNEQQDKAIDAFIEAVQNDPDTTELHFALGNLFRRRGEYNRAVRVHEHLLSRADLTRPDRDRAQHALAQDFLKAGLLDRAEEALNRLEGTQYEGEARLALLAIYERSRDWAQAAAIVRKMQAAGQGTSAPGWPTTFAKTRNPRWPKASSTRRLRSCSRPWRLRRKLRAPTGAGPAPASTGPVRTGFVKPSGPGTEQPRSPAPGGQPAGGSGRGNGRARRGSRSAAQAL